MKKKRGKLMILGSGPAGYTASIYAARANLSPVLITGNNIGGQLTATYSIENWPGDCEHLKGKVLMDRMKNHANKFNVCIVEDEIKEVDFSKKPIFLLGSKYMYITDVLIIATGASAKYLGIESEDQFKGKGVTTCAVCDGFFYKNKNVAVVGGGNTAIEEVLFLSKIVKKVFLIHRSTVFRADKILLNELKNEIKKEKVVVYTEYIVHKFLGDKRGLNGIEIRSKNTLNKLIKLNVLAVFIAIGNVPNTSLFKGQLEMENGYIIVKSGRHGNSTQTNVPGVFAAGDVADHVYRQAITSSATGCMAALDAEKYLSFKK